MIITKQWIHAHKTAGGAWNRKQIEALGLDWPARKGWINDLVGTDINSHQQRVFEKSAKNPAPYRQNKKYESVDKRMAAMECRILELEHIIKQIMPTVN